MPLELNNCPEVWALNCLNYEVMCHECSACDPTNETLYYRNISKSFPLSKHPEYLVYKSAARDARRKENKEKKEANKQYSKNSKQGRKTELKTLAQLGATPTKASGKLLGDGDGFIETPYGKYYIEHKTRIAPRNELGPTSAEWVKGKAQGCQIFITTSEHYGAVVTLPLEIFKQLINYGDI